MTERARTLSRRRFLLTLGAGGAATAAAIATRAPGSASAGKPPAKRATRGYHASEHINNYYRTAKV